MLTVAQGMESKINDQVRQSTLDFSDLVVENTLHWIAFAGNHRASGNGKLSHKEIPFHLTDATIIT